MKTKQRTLGVGGGVLVLLAVYAVDPALCTAATRYVDPAGSDLSNDCSIQTAPCATIGHAIAVASGGDTLQVAAGTYNEQVSIGTSLTLIGGGAGNTIIQAPPTLPSGGNIVTIQGAGVSVAFSGFTVNGPGASGCGSINAGIQVRDHANADIHDNTVSNIRDEPLSGCQNGRAIRIGENASPASGTVTRNTVVGYQKNGIDVRNAATTATISNNTITGAGPTPLIAQNGVVVVSAEATIQGNTVTGNECNHSSCGPDPINDTQSTGVLLLFAQPGTTVSGNSLSANDIGVYNNAVGATTITGNQVRNDRYGGIFLDQGDATVRANVVTGSNVGVLAVSFDGNSDSSVGTLTCNRIESNGVGIQLLDQQPADGFVPTITAHNSSILGNTVGMDNETPALESATGNWWGCATGPGNPGCDTVTGNVDASGPLSVPAACAAATRYVDPAGSDGANDCTIPAQPCATIGHAVAVASPVDTLRVGAGTYSEQVTINISLTLIGAGAGNTMIQAPSNLPAGGNIVTIQGAGTSVEMTGFTVNGPGASGCGSINAGIQVRDHATADIHDNTVSNIRDEPLSGCQNGRAIRIGESATPASATVTGNTIVGYQKNGIDIRHGATTATITNNTITGIGATPLIAQNGVVVVNAGATIQGNMVTGNECDHVSCGPDPINDTQSTGVLLLFAQPGTTVSGNVLSMNDIGVYNNAVGATSISGNQVTSSRYVGICLDQGNAAVSTNAVSGGNIGVLTVSFDGNTDNSGGTLNCNDIEDAGIGIQLLDQQPRTVLCQSSRPTETLSTPTLWASIVRRPRFKTQR